MVYPSSVFQPVQVELAPDLDAIYSNHAVLRYSSNEIALDFTRCMPGTTRRKVDIRVVMSPFNAKLLLAALSDRLGHYERDYGTIRLSADTPGTGNEGGRAASKRMQALPPPPSSQKGQSQGKQPAHVSPRQEVEVPADLSATYSNYAVIRSSALDMVIDFACLTLNAFRTEVCTRVIVSPAGAKMLRQTLEGGLARFEQKYGPIRPPLEAEAEGQNYGIKLWGNPVPFAMN